MQEHDTQTSKVIWSKLGDWKSAQTAKDEAKERSFSLTTPSDDAPKPVFNDWACI